jgi:hypothetical protein
MQLPWVTLCLQWISMVAQKTVENNFLAGKPGTEGLVGRPERCWTVVLKMDLKMKFGTDSSG